MASTSRCCLDEARRWCSPQRSEALEYTAISTAPSSCTPHQHHESSMAVAGTKDSQDPCALKTAGQNAEGTGRESRSQKGLHTAATALAPPRCLSLSSCCGSCDGQIGLPRRLQRLYWLHPRPSMRLCHAVTALPRSYPARRFPPHPVSRHAYSRFVEFSLSWVEGQWAVVELGAVRREDRGRGGRGVAGED